MSLPGIPEHSHCEVCKTPVGVADRFCGSASCAEQHAKNQKEKKRQVYMMVGLIVAAVLLSKLLAL